MAGIQDKTRKRQLRFLSKYKLTLPQFRVLEVLNQNGSLPLKRISELLSVTGANITCVVDNLEKDQLVTRIHSSQDRRIILAQITEKGKGLLESIFPEYQHISDKIMSSLSEMDQMELNRLLDKISGNGHSRA
jgi:MarR family 2-MHQ and catechol resistance regulon transcriptional repressor